MRKLLYFGIGFGVACAIAAYLFRGTVLLIVGILCLMMAVGGLLLFREVSKKRIVSIVLLGLACGMIWVEGYSMFMLSPAQKYDGESIELRVTATDYSSKTNYGSTVPAKVLLAGRSYNCKLYLDTLDEVEPGDRISGLVYLCYTGDGGQRESEYHRANGVRFLGYMKGDVHIERGDLYDARYLAPKLRRRLSEGIEQSFPSDTVTFAKAIMLGDTSGISYALDTALTVSGIVHVVSVSGMHVSILFAVLFFVIGKRRVLTPLVGSALLLFVAALTGFSPSIVRACLMNSLVLFSLMTNREYDGKTALAFASTVILLLNPFSIASVSFQLSVASVAGILLLSSPVYGWIYERPFWVDAKRGSIRGRVRNWLSGAISVSLAASVFTTPLTAIHFGTVSLVGILTNLLTISVLNVVFCGVIFVAVAALIWLPLAKVIAWVISWGIRYALCVAEFVTKFPLAAIYTDSIYVVCWVLICCVLIFVFWLAKEKRVWLLGMFVATSLVLAICASYLEPRLDNYRITVLDVGQGQCVLLQSGGKCYMVDCGGDHDQTVADRAVAAMFSQGIFHLDGLILTHYDHDHVGGVPYLLERVSVDTLYLPVGQSEDMWRSLTENKCVDTIASVSEDLLLEWNGAKLQIFAADSQTSSNESSLCVLFQKKNYDILITGDRGYVAEADLLLGNALPQLDALVAGHHGANTSTSEYLLKMTRPKTVLISVGEHNSYGHPSQDTLKRLLQYGCIIRRTDLEGTIVIRG